MTILIPVVVARPLRQRLIDEMDVHGFGPETQRNYIRDIGRFATFLRHPPDTATAADVRRFQIEQRDLGISSFITFKSAAGTPGASPIFANDLSDRARVR